MDDTKTAELLKDAVNTIIDVKNETNKFKAIRFSMFLSKNINRDIILSSYKILYHFKDSLVIDKKMFEEIRSKDYYHKLLKDVNKDSLLLPFNALEEPMTKEELQYVFNHPEMYTYSSLKKVIDLRQISTRREMLTMLDFIISSEGYLRTNISPVDFTNTELKINLNDPEVLAKFILVNLDNAIYYDSNKERIDLPYEGIFLKNILRAPNIIGQRIVEVLINGRK